MGAYLKFRVLEGGDYSRWGLIRKGRLLKNLNIIIEHFFQDKL